MTFLSNLTALGNCYFILTFKQLILMVKQLNQKMRHQTLFDKYNTIKYIFQFYVKNHLWKSLGYAGRKNKRRKK